MRLLLLIVVVVVSIGVYFDAKKQGYLSSSAYLWLLASLFFPIIAIPFYFLITFKKRFLSAQNEKVQPSIFCPKCGETISKKVSTCPHCGNSLSLS